MWKETSSRAVRPPNLRVRLATSSTGPSLAREGSPGAATGSGVSGRRVGSIPWSDTCGLLSIVVACLELLELLLHLLRTDRALRREEALRPQGGQGHQREADAEHAAHGELPEPLR